VLYFIWKGGNLHFTTLAHVYNYDITCYEILIGYIPIEGYKNGEYDHVLCRVRPILLDYVTNWVKNLVHKCWHQDPLELDPFSLVYGKSFSRMECLIETPLFWRDPTKNN
jgi:hypothetical protein